MDIDNRMEDRDAMDLDQEPGFLGLGESYSSRPIAPSQAFGEASNVGRPKASAPHALVSLENISIPAIERHKRTVHNKAPATTSSTAPIDVDMLEPADAENHGEQDEEAGYNSSDYEDEDDGGEEEEDDEEDEDEDEDEDDYGEEDEDDDDDDDEEEDEEEDGDDEDEGDQQEGDDQEDAARMALQQMLSMYGTG
ncbi:hypothetical protein BGZ72_006547 [Mortierella alpina]|nr:hypothetical protein BGZ72_006547 [Mortierella alpina]